MTLPLRRPEITLSLVCALVAGVLASGCGSHTPAPAHTLSWTTEGNVRWAALPAPDDESAGFRVLDSTATGIAFVNTLSQEEFLTNRHYVNGSGVAVGDVDGDDWPDLYFAHLSGPNVLYRNVGGFQFESVADAGGAALAGEYSTGATFSDVDGDSDLDLIVTTMGGPNLLFRNDGTGQFTEADDAGLRAGDGSTTTTLADVDGDGDLDVYVGNYKKNTVKDLYAPDERLFSRVVVQENGAYTIRNDFREHYRLRQQGNQLMRFEYGEPDRFYLNDGSGQFTEQPWADAFRYADGSPIPEAPNDWALVTRLQDLNGDGHVDLYVCNDFESPDRMYWGNGQGTFTEAPPTALRTTSHSTMSMDAADVDRDGDTDFFLADMLGRSYTQKQTQMGTRAPIPEGVGAARERTQEMQNTLQMNRGDGTFAEVAELSGVEASGWTWSSRFLDVDLDGYVDLLATNGHAYDAMHADTQMRLSNVGYTLSRQWRETLLEFPDLDLQNAAFRNNGDGTFTEVADGWGIGAQPDVSHGLATGDFDRDGDLDVVINRLNQPAGVYQNTAPGGRLAVRLAGRAGNTKGIGATVRVEAEGMPTQTETIRDGGEYLSDSEALLTFATGDAASVRVTVHWPSGERTTTEATPGRLYDIAEPGAMPAWMEAAPQSSSQEGETASLPRPPDGLTAASVVQTASYSAPVSHPPQAAADTGRWFEDVSDRLDHTHPEVKYADFERQPLLPRRLSQQGPGAVWTDLDADGDDDVLLGTGRTGSIAFYRNDNGRFTRVESSDDGPFERDILGMVAAPHAEGATVFVAYGNYERTPQDTPSPASIFVYASDAQGLRRTDTLRFGSSTPGPLALADVDGDGDLDLFVGGRHEPGRYPESASSAVFLNDNGTYERSAAWSRPFNEVGLVSGATFGDFDGDADPDLVLAVEWGPVAYFENTGTGFVDRTDARGLADMTGLWNGVSAGDVNGDGRLDLVATNWGWNSKYGRPAGSPHAPDSPLLPHPLRVYYNDFDRNGSMDLIETMYDEEQNEYLPFEGLSSIGYAMPYVRQRVSTFEEFAQSSLEEILGSTRLNRAQTKEAATLSNMVFLNTADRGAPTFDGRALPMWAQLSAAFAPTLADLDGDGHVDIFLSQNFFATEIETPRQDAGRSLWLRGDGTGTFTPVKGHVSGLTVYGEQRAAPVADFDADGRLDVLVTQNGAETKLFRNVRGTPGVRVKLAGRDANPHGIGATVRLRYADDTRGPAQQVAAGTGYWTQSSSTRVLGTGSRTPVAVDVTWPDGTTSTHTVDDSRALVTASHPDRAS